MARRPTNRPENGDDAQRPPTSIDVGSDEWTVLSDVQSGGLSLGGMDIVASGQVPRDRALIVDPSHVRLGEEIRDAFREEYMQTPRMREDQVNIVNYPLQSNAPAFNHEDLVALLTQAAAEVQILGRGVRAAARDFRAYERHMTGLVGDSLGVRALSDLSVKPRKNPHENLPDIFFASAEDQVKFMLAKDRAALVKFCNKYNIHLTEMHATVTPMPIVRRFVLKAMQSIAAKNPNDLLFWYQGLRSDEELRRSLASNLVGSWLSFGDDEREARTNEAVHNLQEAIASMDKNDKTSVVRSIGRLLSAADMGDTVNSVKVRREGSANAVRLELSLTIDTESDDIYPERDAGDVLALIEQHKGENRNYRELIVGLHSALSDNNLSLEDRELRVTEFLSIAEELIGMPKPADDSTPTAIAIRRVNTARASRRRRLNIKKRGNLDGQG